MYMSPEFAASIVFGVIMVIIGLAAIWIMHWQTHVLLRQRRKSILAPMNLCKASADHDVDVEVDVERAQSTVPNIRSSVELSNLSTAPTLCEEPVLVKTPPRKQEGLDVDDNNGI